MTLQSNMVAQPEHSRLSITVTPTGVEVVVSSRIVDGELIYRHIPFDQGAVSIVRAFEEAVYDNPLLLADFGTVDVLIDTNRFLVVPADRADEAADMLQALYPDMEMDVLVSATASSTTASDAAQAPVIAAAVDPALTGFIRRTWGAATVHHRLSPLCRYFGHQSVLGNTGKLHLHLGDGRADIVAFGSQGLLMANTVAAPTAADVAYFALAATQSLGFDNASDRIVVSGETDRRAELLPMLRRHVSFVMPMIFPSELMKSGRQAMSAPFELVVLPLLK